MRGSGSLGRRRREVEELVDPGPEAPAPTRRQPRRRAAAPARPRPAPRPRPASDGEEGRGGEEAARDLGEARRTGGAAAGRGPAGGVRVKREEGAEEGEGGARGAPSASALDPDGALLPVAASPGAAHHSGEGADALLAIARLHSQ
eukprot:tig00001501_g9224.t1